VSAKNTRGYLKFLNSFIKIFIIYEYLLTILIALVIYIFTILI